MKPVIDTELGAPVAPIAKPQVAGKASGHLVTKVAMAFAALGLSNSAPAALTMTGSPIPVGTMDAKTLSTGNREIPSQHVEVGTTITLVMPAGSENGWTFTVGLNTQIDCMNLGWNGTTDLVDLGYILQRKFTGLSTATLVDTNSTAAAPKNLLPLGANTYDKSYVAPANPILDTWSVGPVTPGTQMTLEYRQIIDSQYAAGTATLGNATPGSLVSPINVYFTPVPEPGIGVLAGIGGLALLRRKRNGSGSTDTPSV